MFLKKLWFMLLVLFACGTAFAAGEDQINIQVAKPGAKAKVDRVIKQGHVLTEVSDAQNNALPGLGIPDFTLTDGGKATIITSALPLLKSDEVPLHYVVVLDNSSSMYHRNAVKPLIAGVEELLKIVRPIDEVQVVVFDTKQKAKVGSRDLNVRIFSSNKFADLKAFIEGTYRDAMTSETVLYDAMLAGLDLIGKMPANEPRFMIVFSDGEDINSTYKKQDVINEAVKVKGFKTYAVDFMPVPETNEFLAAFAATHNGQIWKAKSEEYLVSTFREVVKRFDYFYVLNYKFPPPPPPPPVVAPAPPPPVVVEKQKQSKVMVFETAALFDFNKSVLKPQGKEQIKKYREQVQEDMSRADKIKVTGHTDSIGSAKYNLKLSLKRAQVVRDYLVSLGTDPKKMEVFGVGKDKPIADNKTKAGRAKNRRVEVDVVGLEK